MPPSLLEHYPEDFPEYLSFYIDVFSLLSSSRNIGMSLAFIPVSEIIIFSKEVLGVTSKEDLRILIRYVQAIDEEYVHFHTGSLSENSNRGKINTANQSNRGSVGRRI